MTAADQEVTKRFVMIDGQPFTAAEVRAMARRAREALGIAHAALRDFAAAGFVGATQLGRFRVAADEARGLFDAVERNVR